MLLWPKPSRFAVWCLIATSFSLVNRTTAQTTISGALNGVITDQTNAVVPDAEIEIKDTAKGTTQSTKADSEGLYHFFFLAPGGYELVVTHDGFRQEGRTVQVVLGPPITVNIVLQIATATSEVRVTGESPLIKAENGDVSATMSQKQISELPNQGNDLTNVVQLAPGVLMNTDNNSSPAFSILGMPGTSYLYTIDGMNNTDTAGNVQQVGSLFLTLGQNLVEEATVVSTGYSGQFGGAAGGNINYVTKSGTSQFHGNFQYWWNGRVLNANQWFDKANRGPRPFDIANQWAGSVGGPVKKGKLFFFADNEGLRVTVPQIFFDIHAPSPQFESITLANIDSHFGLGSPTDLFYRKMFRLYDAASSAHPTAPGVFGDPTGLGCGNFQDPNDAHGPGHDNVPCTVHFNEVRGRPSQDMLTSGRLDWNVSDHDRAFVRVQYDGGRSAIFLDAIDREFDADASLPWWQGQILETHTFGSSGASQFLLTGSSGLASYKMRNPSQALSTMPTGLHFNCCEGFNDLGQSGFFNPLGSVFGVPLRYQISEDVMKSWRGHKVGFGGSFEAIHWHMSEYSSNVIGTLEPQSLDAFYWGGFDPNSSNDFTLLFQSFPLSLSQRMAFYNYGLYGQDEWHARKNFSLTFALRAEHKANPSCEQACFARFNGPFESVSHNPNQPYNQAVVTSHHAFSATDTVLWSPRFSFAWQPFGVSHTAVLRGGIGIFYDSNPGYLTFLLSNGIPFVNSYVVSHDNLAPGEESSNLFDDAAASNSAFVNGYKSGQTLAQIQAATSQINGAVFSPPSITVPDTPAHAPQFQKWSFELQEALGVHTSVNVGYFGHHGTRALVQNPSANAWGFGSLPAGRCSDPIPDCAPDPRFGQVTTFRWGAVSNYNGLVASFQHRFSRWASGLVQINYTFGHALDELSDGGLFGFTGGSTVYPQDAKNLRRSYGPAEYDVRHSLNANYVWELPIRAALGGRGPASLVTGWQVSGTVFFHSGFAYSIFDPVKAGALQAQNYFGPIYAVPARPFGADPYCGSGAGFVNPVHPCQPPQVLGDGTPNPNARFVQAGCETGFDQGTLPNPSDPCGGSPVAFAQGRNRFRGPSYFNTDFAIMKNTHLPHWENVSLGLGVQFFNVFNHPSFGLPSNNIDDFGFGWIFGAAAPYTNLMGNNTGGDNARRLIQLKAQLRF